MKVQDFLDNYEYKVTNRILKKEFPFVINIIPTENFEKYETLSFTFIVINPHKFIEVYSDLDLKMYGYLDHLSETFMPGYIYGNSLDFFFTSRASGPTPNLKPIQVQMEDTIQSVHKSGSIPEDLKLKAEIAVSGYMVPKKLIKY